MQPSEWFQDALVEMCFRLFPAMDSDAIAKLVQTIMTLTKIELGRAVGESANQESEVLVERRIWFSKN